MGGVQFKRPKRAAIILALSVLALICLLRQFNPEFLDELECRTYDWRVKEAQWVFGPTASNLAFVSMEDSSISMIRRGLLGRPYGLYWPRHIYGRLVEELSAQGAKCIAFDVLFGELRPDHAPVVMADGVTIMDSDDFFALKMHEAGNVVLPSDPQVTPPDLFTTNCSALGDISTEKDSDGVLRRLKAFNRRWHPAFKSAAKQYGFNLDNAVIAPDRITLHMSGNNDLVVPLGKDGDFDLTDFVGDQIPPGFKRYNKPYERVWDMGIVIAARELNLDLEHAEVDLPHGRIQFQGPNGLERTLPVDANGYFYINWRITPNSPKLLKAPIEDLLKTDMARLSGATNELKDFFRGKLVVVGSAATGNDLTDRGATPLENDTLLVSKHWNVANSVITGDFIRRTPLSADLLIIGLLGILTALLTWQLRAITASVSVALLVVAYGAMAFWVFVHFRLWLPLVYPVGGAMLTLHGLLLVHLVVFEEQDKRRVKSIFSKLVSPKIVNELLDAKNLTLVGAHREVTIFFADIRGFTAFTDQAQEQIAKFIREHPMDTGMAEKHVQESARETLETVNLYLTTVAEAVKRHDGTLDKYIGDCVMAFWNAPTANERHALACVMAAIDAQRAIRDLNEQRLAQNPAREIENQARLAAGLPLKPMHVALQLGSGINSGLITVGLMGSDQDGLNYTVFGREVNLASRLEGVSGSGRIIISEATYFHLERHASDLAGTCIELAPEKVKGFRDAVRIYEVPWRNK
jgi:class 3 adenylate cyclase/CHASE2 domain-containing sensor protein